MATPNPRAAGRRARERDARILAIRAAGERIFSTKGFESATMEMVAEEAELGKATLYYYFKNKQELFAAIVSEAGRTLESRAHREMSLAEGDPLLATAALCRFAVDFFAERPRLASLLVPLMAARPGVVEERLGKKVAKDMGSAHTPILDSLSTLGRGLPRSSALTDLLASVLLGISMKLGSASHAAPGEVEAARAAAHDEIDLLFSFLEDSKLTDGE